MAEDQQRHIQKMDEKAIDLTAAERMRGQFLGFAAAIAAFATVVSCAFLGAITPASIVGGTTTLGIVGIFVLGKLIQASGSSDDGDESDDDDDQKSQQKKPGSDQ